MKFVRLAIFLAGVFALFVDIRLLFTAGLPRACCTHTTCLVLLAER